MKVSREQAEQNRASLLDAASRLYREHGFDGIGVGQVAKEAGLTHGGLYAHFDSKDDFIAEACTRAFGNSLGKLAAIQPGDAAGFARFLKNYLSDRHREAVGAGCPVAALAADCVREGGQPGAAMSAGIKRYVELFEPLLAASEDAASGNESHAHDEAMVLLSTIVGALVLSRATRSDAALSRGFLASARAHVGQRIEAGQAAGTADDALPVETFQLAKSRKRAKPAA
ncbi:TetR/AcrR family transcriptional regulator [Paraburkholderia sp. BCC1886]|uniref:TetR/AcrR family transcriptional regulator n=1 Tax=Paraburkholderia sp. BCC1886 TaxID=2562670 RepID=UPI001182FBEB|nr:TetR/AcrR family transcriptional regulator [Paraburkholderia sp. BCC1886]